MSNCIKNELFIRGPIALVDENRSRIFSWKPAFVLPPESVDIQVDPDRDTKTVKCSFETPSDAPWDWFKATVAKYHDQGVRFFLSWIDDDNIHRSDLAPDGDLIYTRFGEYYTDLISPSDFNSSAGYRATDGPITLIFNQRIIHGDPVDELLTESGQIITFDKSGNVMSKDGVPYYRVPGDYDPTLPAVDDDGNELAGLQS